MESHQFYENYPNQEKLATLWRQINLRRQGNDEFHFDGTPWKGVGGVTNWQKVKLVSILTESKVESVNPDVSKRLRIKLNTKGVEKRPETNDKEGATKYYIRKYRQFIYGRQNLHKGAFGVVPLELDGFESSADIPAFDVDEKCLPEWIELFLKQGNYYLHLEKMASGVGSKRIGTNRFLSLEIPLPSMTEQMEILKKFQRIELENVELKSELTHQQTLLKKLRQQILQEAIEGKLTAEWRSNNPDVEPASELLKRIADEKEQLIKDKKIKSQKTHLPISEKEKPFELPEGWMWCRLSDFGEIKGGGTPSKGNLNESIYQITSEAVGKSSAKLISEKSILFVVRGMILSHTFPVAINTGVTTVNQDMKALSPFIKGLEEYLYLVLRGGSEHILKNVRTSTHGTCRLESNVYFSWVVGVPSLSEQKAIVAKVEKLLTLCDQLEAQINQNQTNAEQLMQAVLKEAFQSIAN